MVTYLVALRFAANVEHLLGGLQRTLFSERAYSSARALPPLIPLAWTADRPPDRTLERIRKTHMVRLAPHAGSAGRKTPCTIRIEDRTPILSVADALAEIGTPIMRERAAIHLAWECEEDGESPIPLPGTSALWLSIIRIQHSGDSHTGRPEGLWWDGVRWIEEYRRRLTVREHRA